MPWARDFCPLPFPSAGDRWFRAYWIISSVQVNIVLVVFFTCPRVATEKQREVLIIEPLNERKIMDEKTGMALRHSDRHFDSHGHCHGPWRDELHVGSVVTIQNPLQDTHLGGEYKAQRGVSRAGYCRSLRLLCWSELSPAQSQIFRQRSPRSSTSAVPDLPPAQSQNFHQRFFGCGSSSSQGEEAGEM